MWAGRCVAPAPPAAVCSPPNKGGSQPPLPLGTLQESPSLQQQKPFLSQAPLSPGCNPLHCPLPAPAGCLEPSLAPACPSPSRGAADLSCRGDPGRLVPSCSWASTCPRCSDFAGGNACKAEGPTAQCSLPGTGKGPGGAGIGKAPCAWGAWLGVLASPPHLGVPAAPWQASHGSGRAGAGCTLHAGAWGVQQELPRLLLQQGWGGLRPGGQGSPAHPAASGKKEAELLLPVITGEVDAT